MPLPSTNKGVDDDLGTRSLIKSGVCEFTLFRLLIVPFVICNYNCSVTHEQLCMLLTVQDPLHGHVNKKHTLIYSWPAGQLTSRLQNNLFVVCKINSWPAG